MEVKSLRKLLFVAMLVLLTVIAVVRPGQVYADVCGTLSSSQTWTAGDNVHIVTCDVTIPTGITLTIEAGAIIKFQKYTQINVNGKLIAEGTSSAPIYFTSYYDDTIGDDTDGTPTTPQVADWGNIVFNSGSDDASLITRAVIRYSGNDVGGVSYGAILLDNASPQLSYITFTDNYINGVEIARGTWETDTWDNTTVIYTLEKGDLTVRAGHTLTINPGMMIKLNKFADIRVDGKLVVPGTTSDLVYFSSVFDDILCGTGAFDEDICDTHNDGSPLTHRWVIGEILCLTAAVMMPV